MEVGNGGGSRELCKRNLDDLKSNRRQQPDIPTAPPPNTWPAASSVTLPGSLRGWGELDPIITPLPPVFTVTTTGRVHKHGYKIGTVDESQHMWPGHGDSI